MKRKEKPHSVWLRCARLVTSQYKKQKTGSVPNDPADFAAIVKQIDRQQSRLATTRSQGWKAAEAKAYEDYRRQLRILRERVESALEEVGNPNSYIVNEVDLFRDLLTLKEEFTSATFSKREMWLSIVTKDIVLEDFRLGAFRVELHLDSLSSNRPYYEVIATDANRPSSNDGVTHPHVQDDRLCEGDGQPAINLALQQGRLLDFFQLVEQVLGTYNPSSAYVSIRDWDGATCGHCGQSTDPEDCRECSSCDAFICDECVYRCSDCEDPFCGNCDEPCSGCLESICKFCIRSCSECDERHCFDCLSENERCTSCEEKTKEEGSKSGDANTAIHTHSVGQAVVSS